MKYDYLHTSGSLSIEPSAALIHIVREIRKLSFMENDVSFFQFSVFSFFIHLIATSRRQTLQDVIFFATMLQMKLLWLLYRTLAHDKTP